MRDFESYVTPTKKDKLIMVIVGIVMLVCGAVFLLRKSYILMAVMLLGGLVLLYAAITSSAQQKKFIEGLKDSGQYSAVVRDFQSATEAAGGRLLFGEQFIFREKLPELLRYEDIGQARYLERHDNETSSTERSIVIKLTNGKGRTLCSLCESTYREDASVILSRLQAKNPSITIK